MSALVHVAAVVITTLASILAWFTGVPVTAQEPQVIRRTMQWPAGTRERGFELSNITGAVRIIGESRSDVSVVATRTITRQGRSGDSGPTADFRDGADTLVACGDSRRCGCHVESRSRDMWDDEDRTRVRTDFEVHVPRGISLQVCTVNGGTLRVQGTEGPFRISNVNGDIEAADISGSGNVSTVNGEIDATLTGTPTGPTTFRSVNGRIVVRLPASLSADLRLNTVHGGVYTDFETTPLPARPTSERHDGRFVYRFDRYANVRVGAGGPQLQFETVNGDIQVRKK
jgi:hypothetical protein